MPSPRALDEALGPPGPEILNQSSPNEIQGQDHDRMETDEEDEDSDEAGSEHQEDTPGPDSHEGVPEAAPPPVADDESMDTSPDNPPIAEPPPLEIPSQADPGGASNTDSNEPAGLHLVHVHIPPGDFSTQASQTVTADGLTPNAADEARVRAAERESEDLRDNRSETRRVERVRAQRIRRETTVTGDDAEDDDNSDDSSDQEEHPYWVDFKEDTSAPDDKELEMIEGSGNEFSALDHEHWEKLIYEPVEDPEYIPSTVGRISWTVKAVHGTPEKPNREKIMRSPSVYLGGFYWNIKYYPHGNDGTEQLSIYIECSPNPPEPKDDSEDITTSEPTSMSTQTVSESSAQGTIREESAAGRENSLEAGPLTEMVDGPSAAATNNSKQSDSWATAAQIGCVLYNPEEPRVNAFQKGCHRYYDKSPDWGWTRFHGPWDEIHKRQRFQRQALLRNDTLTFTAYIRTIEDDTNALWWHPPKESPEWNSEEMTGFRPFGCLAYQSSAMTAAVSTWLHLKPIQSLICNTTIPNPVCEPDTRMRPAFEELQDIYDEGRSSSPLEDPIISLRGLVSILNSYGAHVDSKMDVVRIWETLRRVLTFEASSKDSVIEVNESDDLFRDVLLLRQPDMLEKSDKLPQLPNSWQGTTALSDNSESRSVQETIDRAICNDGTPLLRWQGFEGQHQEINGETAVFQIELHRQNFDKEARKWQKLTHKIKMDETVLFNGNQYTLYGMIVHNGDLESNDYSSVVRPGGPKTRWIKYAGDSHERKVTVLTSKQAIDAHEGAGENANGSAAVAYVVLYVRSAMLAEILCDPLRPTIRQELDTHRSESQAASQVEDMVISNDSRPEMPILLYAAEGFEGYDGRGICDPWTFLKQKRSVQKATFPGSTTIEHIKKFVNESLFGKSRVVDPETEEIRIWPMNTFVADDGIGLCPSLLSFSSYHEETLDEMGAHSGGCRFWWKVTKKANVPAPEVPAPTQPSEVEVEVAQEQEARDAAIQAIIMETQAAIDQASERAQSATDTELVDANRQRLRRQQQLLLQMQQAQQQQQQLLAAQQAQQRQQEADRNARESKRTYFFVKIFDVETQSLRGIDSAVVKSSSKILEETKKILKVDSSEAWDCYHERGIEVESQDMIKSQETFESRWGGADGIIIIAQRRLSTAK